MLCWCARPPGRDERDQAAGGLGGMRVGLVDLHRHADVAADRRVGWVSVSEDGDAVHEDLPPKAWPCRAYSYRVGRRRHGMATATCRGNGETDSTRSRSSIGSRPPQQVVDLPERGFPPRGGMASNPFQTCQQKEAAMQQQDAYPVRFTVDYPDRRLDRVTTGFRIFVAMPIMILLGTVSGGGSWESSYDNTRATTVAAGGLLFFGPLLMILFRQKYPRWWFDWNLELQRFGNRVGAYLALMDDRYPATDEHQSVHLDYPYPDAQRDLNRWLPLVKWLLAIPHYVVLFFLWIAALLVVIVAWIAILFTGRYPRGMFEFVEGVIRWNNRVIAYAWVLVTDRYPPFRLTP